MPELGGLPLSRGAESQGRRDRAQALPSRALTLLIILAAAIQAGGQTQPKQNTATSRPATAETVAAAHQRLAAIDAKKLTREQLVLRTVLDLVLAIGNVDGERAAVHIDAVGYQRLPLEGDLPQNPDRPLPAREFKKHVAARKPLEVGKLPVKLFEVTDRTIAHDTFPAVADWMLPHDFAVLIRPSTEPGKALASRPCCVVVRLRARKPSIIGGNVLAALGEGADKSAP